EQVVKTCPGLSADEIKECLTQALRRFTADAPQRDDVTVVIIRVDRAFRTDFVVL
ncbi:MAG: hypothetical protein FJY97_04425, partial [candidate division Zixibacteria bacterium]|nr:hypothetical protein [candidate division Zixibacteria bacterium]